MSQKVLVAGTGISGIAAAKLLLAFEGRRSDSGKCGGTIR